MAMTAEGLNLAEILSETYELSEMITSSEEMKAYRETKQDLSEDVNSQAMITAFQKLKDQHEEVQRFGKYHPDYHKISKEMRLKKRELDMLPAVHAFKQAEKALENLLIEVSQTIASAISPTIKVPGNNPFDQLGGGCGGGGCGTGGCGCK
jgi:cell fate (sporulation/competence/biofilm development) regulator YlbF (YheA/YmcA/DUF963 family)